MKTSTTILCSIAILFTILSSASNAQLVVDLTAASGTDTTVDGATVTTWESSTAAGNTTFTRSDADARYVADSGGGMPAIDFDRSAPFLGDFSVANGGPTIGDATIFAWANFDGYTDHGVTSSSYYYSINGNGNEHTLGRDGNAGTDYIYHWDGVGESTGTLQPQPAGWNLYIARFFGASLVGSRSVEVWIDPVGDGAVVTGTPDLTNEDGTAYNANASEMRVGTWTNGGSGLDGQIRAIRVYNSILSDADVMVAAREITGVPEPSALMLLMISGLGILACARRR
jgi:hypothetical protein